MSTEPAATEDATPGTPEGGAADDSEPTPDETAPVDETEDAEAVQDGAPTEDADDADTPDVSADADDKGASEGESSEQLSETEAEIAAQRELRERIEQRKASKQAPIEAGTKLSGTAADLLAAVRAVESGEKPVASAFQESGPAPRRPAPARAPEPVRPQQPTASRAPATETVEAVRAVLAEGGAPPALAEPTAAALGEGAEEDLRADPWQLLRVPGVRPEQADGFARALLGAECRPDDERRGRAVTVWLLEQAAVAGHTALDLAALTAALGQRAVPDPDAAVQSALAEGDALVFQDVVEGADVPVQRAQEEARGGGADDAADEGAEEGPEPERPVRVLIGLERYALAEESLADGLARVVNSRPGESGSDPAADDWEAAAAQASGSTAELIRAVAGHGLVLHSGGEEARAEPA
ncbi:helix-hairpin-helix domain-containing protein, partial [Streptomyces sp. NPDC005918]